MELKDRRKVDKTLINSELRRGFMLGHVVVLPIDREVVIYGQRKHLAPKAIEMLLFLASNVNRLVSSQRLLSFGWGNSNAKRNNLTHVISEIRSALNDHKECPEFIQTIPRRGYRLIAEVKPIEKNILYPNIWPIDSSPVQASKTENNEKKNWHISIALLKNSKLFQVSAGFSIITWVIIQIVAIVFPIFNVPDWGMKLVVLIFVIGLPLILLFTWFKELKVRKALVNDEKSLLTKKYFYRQLAFDFTFIGSLSAFVGFLSLYLIDSIEIAKEQQPNKSASLVFPVKDNLLAVTSFHFDDTIVLPNYFKTTLQGELINSLNKQQEIQLVSKRAVNELKANSSLEQYANKLGVKYLLEGKVSGIDSQITISMNITDTQNYIQLWSSKVSGNKENLLSLQKSLTRKIFNALSLIAKSKVDDKALGLTTEDFNAYDNYIQGKNELSKTPSADSMLKAEQFFLTALTYDANFAQASAGLCQTYLEKYQLTLETAAFKSAQQMCSHLITNSQIEEEALLALGNLNQISGEYPTSIQFYQQTLALNDLNILAILGLAESHNAMGDVDNAEDLFAKAIQVEPGYWKNYLSFGNFYFNHGQFSKAEQQYHKVTLLKPNYEQGFNSLGAAYFLNNNLEKASETWEKALKINGSATTLSNLGTTYYFRHQFEKAKTFYQQAVKQKLSDPILWGNLGDAQKLSGDKTGAQTSYLQAYRLANEKLLINPNDLTTKTILARYQSELGDCDNAMLGANSIDMKTNTDPYLYYDNAIVALNCNQIPLAKTLIKRMLALGYSSHLLAQDVQFSSVYPLETNETQ